MRSPASGGPDGNAEYKTDRDAIAGTRRKNGGGAWGAAGDKRIGDSNSDRIVVGDFQLLCEQITMRYGKWDADLSAAWPARVSVVFALDDPQPPLITSSGVPHPSGQDGLGPLVLDEFEGMHKSIPLQAHEPASSPFSLVS